jgi:HEAT repeat protein
LAASRLPKAAEGVETLLAALKDDDASVRALAVEHLPRNDQVRPALLRALGDEDARVRLVAVREVSRFPGPEEAKAAAALLALADDPDPAVVDAVAEWMDLLTPGCIPVLVKALEETDPARARLALRALCRMYKKGEPAREALLRRLDAKDPLERTMAATALCANVRDKERAVPVLLAALESSDPDLVLETCRLMADSPWWIGSLDEFRRLGAPVGRTLARLVRHGPGEIRRAAAKALENDFDDIDEVEATLAAQAYLRNLSEERAKRVALSGTADPQGGGGMFTVASHNVPIHAWACIRNLARSGSRDPEFLELLGWAAGSGDPVLEDWARVARRHLGLEKPPTLESIATRLADEDPRVRWRAVKDLASHGAAARPLAGKLEALLEDEDRLVRVAARAALAAIGRKR